MFGSLVGIFSDVVKVAVAPVELALDLTSTVTKPVADEVQKAVKTIKEDLKS